MKTAAALIVLCALCPACSFVSTVHTAFQLPSTPGQEAQLEYSKSELRDPTATVVIETEDGRRVLAFNSLALPPSTALASVRIRPQEPRGPQYRCRIPIFISLVDAPEIHQGFEVEIRTTKERKTLVRVPPIYDEPGIFSHLAAGLLYPVAVALDAPFYAPLFIAASAYLLFD